MNRRQLLQSAAALAATHTLAQVPAINGAVGPRLTAPTTAGKISGYLSGPIIAFKGIPYGADTATTRFAPPRPPAPWKDIRPCTTWGPRSPQVPGARPRPDAPVPIHTGYHLPPDQAEESEDCLHLNLWTPALDKKPRPVMVYIHGGAYSNGTVNAELYDGTNLARRGDVVVVTVNHRLNLFGYLYLDQLLPHQGFADSGNAGQLDLILALQWVRDNIANFGGDPSLVTIFGQSGGGAKCATLMAQPAAHGLFHRVITMSGQQVTGASLAAATDRTSSVLAALDLDPRNPAVCANTLRTLPWQTLQQAVKAAGYYGPVTDGRSLPHDPFSPTAPALSSNIPMMLGNTHDETRGLIGSAQPALFALTWDTLPSAIEHNAAFIKSRTISLPVPEVIAKYREWHPTYTPSDVFFAVTTDSRSWRGQVIEAEARAADPIAQPRTWVYQLNWKSPVDDYKFGAPHTLDIPLAFDNIHLAPGMVGSTPADLTRAQRMADIVSTRYLNFARHGNPNTPATKPGTRSDTTPDWPPYNLTQRPTLIFDDPTRLENDPRGPERRYLGQVPYTQPGT